MSDDLEKSKHREQARSATLKWAADACASCVSADSEALKWLVGWSSSAFEMFWRAREHGISSDRLKRISLRALAEAIDRELGHAPTTLVEVEYDD